MMYKCFLILPQKGVAQTRKKKAHTFCFTVNIVQNGVKEKNHTGKYRTEPRSRGTHWKMYSDYKYVGEKGTKSALHLVDKIHATATVDYFLSLPRVTRVRDLNPVQQKNLKLVFLFFV